ncbi:MAG TPA: BadF/BadG/BcrA/BcrD ATPase family protein [Streptosporangiaceae bacterium]
MTPIRLLGLDIGGTSSRAQVVVDGIVEAEARAASASLTAAGSDSAAVALGELLAQLPAGEPFDAVCAGSAGSNVPGAREFLAERLAPLTRTGTVIVVNDASLVLPAAGLDEGVAVICGTGSIAVGTWQGREARSGGFGYLLGDEGSGYWITRAAVRALLDRRDRAVPLGVLGEVLLTAAGASHIDELHRMFYDHPHPRRWARHAPLVLDADDPAARSITVEAAQALAALATSAMRRLAWPAGLPEAPPSGLPVVLGGGLMGHPRLRDAAVIATGGALPGSEVLALTEPPVAGAVRLAGAAARSAPASS